MAETLRKPLQLVRRRYKQFLGKVRRFCLCVFHKKYIASNEMRRSGECVRCGQCCKLVFRCPFLKEEDGQTTCVIYGFRLAQCKMFPIDERDIGELQSECGYQFAYEESSRLVSENAR